MHFNVNLLFSFSIPKYSLKIIKSNFIEVYMLNIFYNSFFKSQERRFKNRKFNLKVKQTYKNCLSVCFVTLFIIKIIFCLQSFFFCHHTRLYLHRTQNLCQILYIQENYALEHYRKENPP